MKATLTNYHQAPRKVRLVANLIRGKSVPAARVALTFLPKKSGPVMMKLLESAVANARMQGATGEELYVKTITVDKGMVMKRSRPFARGRSGSLHKQMSIVKLELAVSSAQTPKKGAAKAAKKVAAKPRAKKAAKKVTKENE